MIEGIYTSASSMLPRTFQQVIEADNIANAQVPGHKRSNVFIRTLADASQYLTGGARQPVETRESEEIIIDFEQGNLVRTGDFLHAGIQGDGFFVIDTPIGPAYTRGGQFARSAENELITIGGHRVQGQNGPIVLEGREVIINDNGEIKVDGETVDFLKIVDFDKPYRLTKSGNNTFITTDPGDTGFDAEDFQIRQGFLESSNVQTVEAMVNMITLERTYESGQKSIQYQDETLNKAVNDLGRVR